MILHLHPFRANNAMALGALQAHRPAYGVTVPKKFTSARTGDGGGTGETLNR
jgi:hypothetical protein